MEAAPAGERGGVGGAALPPSPPPPPLHHSGGGKGERETQQRAGWAKPAQCPPKQTRLDGMVRFRRAWRVRGAGAAAMRMRE
jgi:hypothetical protein